MDKLISAHEALKRLGLKSGGYNGAGTVKRLANYGITVVATTGDTKKWYFVQESQVEAALAKLSERREEIKRTKTDQLLAGRKYVRIDEVHKLEELVLRLIDEIENLKREVRAVKEGV